MMALQFHQTGQHLSLIEREMMQLIQSWTSDTFHHLTKHLTQRPQETIQVRLSRFWTVSTEVRGTNLLKLQGFSRQINLHWTEGLWPLRTSRRIMAYLQIIAVPTFRLIVVAKLIGSMNLLSLHLQAFWCLSRALLKCPSKLRRTN